MALVQGYQAVDVIPEKPKMITVISHGVEIQVPEDNQAVFYSGEQTITAEVEPAPIEPPIEETELQKKLVDYYNRQPQVHGYNPTEIHYDESAGVDWNAVSSILENGHTPVVDKLILDEAIKQYLDLLKQRDALKDIDQRIQIVTDAIIQLEGYGHMFQDEDGTVYRVQPATGTFVPYKQSEIVHTRRKHLGETHGQLSLLDARDAGFVVP